MAQPADRFSEPSLPSVAPAAHTPLCRVHSCRRCHRALASADPCSLSGTYAQLCATCLAEEETLKHVPLSRSVWGANLARSHRAA
jgi:hypothetical protein